MFLHRLSPIKTLNISLAFYVIYYFVRLVNNPEVAASKKIIFTFFPERKLLWFVDRIHISGKLPSFKFQQQSWTVVKLRLIETVRNPPILNENLDEDSCKHLARFYSSENKIIEKNWDVKLQKIKT